MHRFIRESSYELEPILFLWNKILDKHPSLVAFGMMSTSMLLLACYAHLQVVLIGSRHRLPREMEVLVKFLTSQRRKC